MHALLLATALLATPPAASPKVVAVLYFDNNTPDREYDVLQKGLADMLITDLASVPGLKVVERERLQDLIAELKLQRTTYFDPRTAVRLGKGVGAQYAITGALTQFSPTLRLDIRLIDIGTSHVVTAEKVSGDQDKFFELETELVRRFLRSLGMAPPAGSSTGAVDLQGALTYSKGLDLADRGEFKAASERMAEALRDSPDFSLAREKYAAILKRLREAGQQRQTALSADEQGLLDEVQASFKRGLTPPLKPYELDGYFCHRGVYGNYLLSTISKRLGPATGPSGRQLAGKADRAAVLENLQKFYASWAQVEADARSVHQTLVYQNHALSCPMALHQLGSKAFYRLKPLGVPFYFSVKVHPVEVAANLAMLTFVGEYWLDDDATFKAAPTLFQLAPEYGAKVMALMDDAEKEIGRKPEASRSVEQLQTELTEARAVGHLMMRNPEAAINVLQAFLEKYPRSSRYREFEKLVEDLIGTSADAVSAQKALKACDLASLNAGDVLEKEVSRVADAQGARGLRALLAKVGTCEGELAKSIAQRAYRAVAGQAVMYGDCALLKEVDAVQPSGFALACD